MTALRCEKEPVRPDNTGVSWVWCVNDNVMYEMNYKSLICCLVEIEIQFMKIYIYIYILF